MTCWGLILPLRKRQQPTLLLDRPRPANPHFSACTGDLFLPLSVNSLKIGNFASKLLVGLGRFGT
jgi:hypothetical protein